MKNIDIHIKNGKLVEDGVTGIPDNVTVRIHFYDTDTICHFFAMPIGPCHGKIAMDVHKMPKRTK